MKKSNTPAGTGADLKEVSNYKSVPTAYKSSDANGVDEMVLDEHIVFRKGTEMVDGITLEDDDEGVDHYPPKHIRSAVRARAALRFMLGRRRG